jgi:hypothetical protein
MAYGRSSARAHGAATGEGYMLSKGTPAAGSAATAIAMLMHRGGAAQGACDAESAEHSDRDGARDQKGSG